MRLQEKIALVTGSSRGIGRAIALGFAKEGGDVIVSYVKNKEAAREVVSQIKQMGRKSVALQADLGKLPDIKRLVERSWAEFGRIDILVNNAGVAYIEPFDKITEETWDRTLGVNLKGTFFCSQEVARLMIKNKIKGKIINMSATNGKMAEADTAHYNASKGGVDMLTQSLAIELAPCGINVNGLAPGVIKTEIDVDFFADPEFEEHYRRNIPLGKFGEVEECVGAAIFLATADSSYITGHTIVIDGGLTTQQVPKLEKCGDIIAGL